MEFEVLGPVRLHAGGAVALSGRLQRTLLGMLLARANHPVSVDVLTDALWDGAPDDRAEPKLQLHVHRLRRTLAMPDRLALGPGGYRLTVLPDELDADRFEVLVDEATQLGDHDPARVVEVVRKALDLWRGDPYEGLDVPELVAEAQRLSDRRLAAIEELYQAELAIGRDAALVADLTDLVRRHPLRERLHGLLMVALYRSGRQADALQAYQDARRTLVDELGLEPSPGLRSIEQRILAGEPVTFGTLPAARVAPAQLPTRVRGFVGRDAELAKLDALLDELSESTIVATLTGTGGVGKTALALEWAHRIRDRFPDGQLHVDLRGYGPQAPLSPGHVLGGFLRALGVDGASIPSDLDERGAQFRTTVDGRRMLLVLDNARSFDQVRPLLPGTPGCLVLVTARDSLTGLGVREGAYRVELDRLSPDEAELLMRDLLGELATSSPEWTERLVEQCVRLPLALRIAADLVRTRPARGVAGLVAELADEHDRLDLLDVDDEQVAVRSVFSWSYQQLPARTQRVFRMCGLHPGYSFDAYALAALADCRRVAAQRAIDALVRAHLAEEDSDGRFRLHDLLRVYARELAEGVESQDEREAARLRLVDFYLATASVATDLAGLLGPDGEYRTTADVPSLAVEADGIAWLDVERSNLLATAEASGPSRVAAFVDVLRGYLFLRAHVDDAGRLETLGMEAARARGDKAAEASALRFLGIAAFDRAEFDVAGPLFERALERFAEIGDLGGQGAVANALGGMSWFGGDLRAALAHFERSVALNREAGNRARLASPLANLAYLHGWAGNYEQAFESVGQAIAIAEELGDRNGRAHALINLARLCERTGRLDEGLAHADEALKLAGDGGVRFLKDETLNVMGAIHRELGDLEQAMRCHREAYEQAMSTGKRAAIADALNGLAAVHRLTGELELAAKEHGEALDLGVDAGVRHLQARALDGIGDVAADRGDDAEAADHWHRALAIYEALEVPEAGEVRSKLAARDRVPPGSV